MHSSRQQGYMLIQLVIGIMILIIIASVAGVHLSNFSDNQRMNNASDEVVALLGEARARTIARDHDLVYGVHLETDAATLFSGGSYVFGGDGNKVVRVPRQIEIAEIALAEGGTDIVFDPLTGDTEDYGSFVVRRGSTTVEYRTIEISRAGIASIN